MVHMEMYDSHESMMEALRERRRRAHEGLHDLQRSVTYGSYWVQFADLDTNWIVFGRVHTLAEVADAEVLAGVTYEEMEQAVAQTERMNDEHLLYGMAHDKHNVPGELGVTHRAHMWPIEARLFAMARDVDFDISRLDEVGRILLEIAFRQMRAHVVTKWSQT